MELKAYLGAEITLGWAAQIREGLSEVAFLRTGHIFQ